MMTNERFYTSYERANLAFSWCFPDVKIPEPYTEDDSEESCEMAVMGMLGYIKKTQPNHPLKLKYHTLKRIIKAFEEQYPTKEDNI